MQLRLGAFRSRKRESTRLLGRQGHGPYRSPINEENRIGEFWFVVVHTSRHGFCLSFRGLHPLFRPLGRYQRDRQGCYIARPAYFSCDIPNI